MNRLKLTAALPSGKRLDFPLGNMPDFDLDQPRDRTMLVEWVRMVQNTAKTEADLRSRYA